jgi:glucan phosphorylase
VPVFFHFERTGGRPEQIVAQSLVVLEPAWWTEAQDLFQELSPRGWQNLYTTPWPSCARFPNTNCACACRTRIRRAASAGAARFRNYLQRPEHLGPPKRAAIAQNPVAYFSAEFGFHETLPISAGGLGILAGDHAKSASDLNSVSSASACFIAKAIFSRPSTNNWQTEYYTLLDPQNLPLEPVLDAKGEPAGLHGGNRHERRSFPGLARQRGPRAGLSCWTPTARKTSSISAT